MHEQGIAVRLDFLPEELARAWLACIILAFEPKYEQFPIISIRKSQLCSECRSKSVQLAHICHSIIHMIGKLQINLLNILLLQRLNEVLN